MANKSGWFLKICKTETEVSSIELWVGLGGDDKSHRKWRDWHSNEDAEIDFPDDLIAVKEVWIKGKGVPEGRNVHMCVHYRDHVTQKMEFDGRDGEEHETSQNDSDSCAC